MSRTEQPIPVGGPFYEQLSVGQRFHSPGLTLTSGLAALHQAIVGDRLALALDADLCQQVAGVGAPLAHPGLVCDVAIGQSTAATVRVIGNLFYRGLVLHRWPRLGDTLRTVTEVVALRDNAPRAGRAPTGLAVLRVRTVDQQQRAVLDYHRCAMLPMRDEQARPGHQDDLQRISAQLDPQALLASVRDLDFSRYRELVPGPHAEALSAGQRYVVEVGDTVSAAPELVRATLNLAAAHADPSASGRGRRLVYGGHTIGIAAAQLSRALPALVGVVAWRSCDHLAPVYEGDVLYSEVEVQELWEQTALGAVGVELHVRTDAARAAGGEREPVLDWRAVGVMAR